MEEMINDSRITINEDTSGKHRLAELVVGALFVEPKLSIARGGIRSKKDCVFMVISINEASDLEMDDAVRRTQTPVINLNNGKVALMDNDTYVQITKSFKLEVTI